MDRGEDSFVKLPAFAAKIYNKMMSIEPIKLQISQIARDILSAINEGKLLDIGTGHGKLLKEIYRLNPKIELYGLDISEAMINLAQSNLKDITVELIVRNVISTSFDNDFFDLITCTGSFYLWNQPEVSLNEIFRMLKPKCKAVFYETYKNYNKTQFKAALKANLKEESLFNKIVLPWFLKKQLKMTYSVEEAKNIIESSKFGNYYDIQKITIASLPIWMRIELIKP